MSQLCILFDFNSFFSLPIHIFPLFLPLFVPFHNVKSFFLLCSNSKISLLIDVDAKESLLPVTSLLTSLINTTSLVDFTSRNIYHYLYKKKNKVRGPLLLSRVLLCLWIWNWNLELVIDWLGSGYTTEDNLSLLFQNSLITNRLAVHDRPPWASNPFTSDSL